MVRCRDLGLGSCLVVGYMEGVGLVVLLPHTTTSALTEGVGRGGGLYGTVHRPWFGQSGGRLYGGRGVGRSSLRHHHISSD